MMKWFDGLTKARMMELQNEKISSVVRAKKN